MPLEFALRPHFDLDRPVRRRRVVRSRFLRFAVPTLAYWLAIAGATYAFVSSVGEHAPAPDTEATASDVPRVFEPPPSLTVPQPAPGPAPHATEADAMPEPAPLPPPAPAPEPPPQPPPESAPEQPVATRAASEPKLSRSALPLAPAPTAPARLAAPDPFAALDPFAPPERPVASRTDVADDRHARTAAAAGVENRNRVQDEARAASLPSCESARASANETIEVGAARGAPDVTRDAFASVLEDGSYLNQCAVPARTALDICAAVQEGKVVGLTVSSEPRSPAINACVRRAVTGLRFPHSVRLDVTRTRFAPSR
jgi:hypothetical protein